MNDSLPYTAKEWLKKAENYLSKEEILFHAAPTVWESPPVVSPGTPAEYIFTPSKPGAYYFALKTSGEFPTPFMSKMSNVAKAD
jgi:hypothetical protein